MMAPRKSDEPLRFGSPAMVELAVSLTPWPPEITKLCILKTLVGVGSKDNLFARELAARMIREGVNTPEFLAVVAELLSPKKKGRGAPQKTLRKFEVEICASYFVLCNDVKLFPTDARKIMSPTEARKIVVEEFKRVVSLRLINQILTEYASGTNELAARAVIERGLIPGLLQQTLDKYRERLSK